MRLMENTAFHKTLPVFRAALSYFPTGRKDDKLRAFPYGSLQDAKAIPMLSLPSLPRSNCFQMSRFLHIMDTAPDKY